MVGMRTSMAMSGLLWEGWVDFRTVRAGASSKGFGCVLRAGVGAPRAAGPGAARTHRAGEPAQVDVEPRHEQHARRLLAHVIENHELIVSIPDPAPGSVSRDTHGKHPRG